MYIDRRQTVCYELEVNCTRRCDLLISLHVEFSNQNLNAGLRRIMKLDSFSQIPSKYIKETSKEYRAIYFITKHITFDLQASDP